MVSNDTGHDVDLLIDDENPGIDARRDTAALPCDTASRSLDTSATTQHSAETRMHGSATRTDTSATTIDTVEPIHDSTEGRRDTCLAVCLASGVNNDRADDVCARCGLVSEAARKVRGSTRSDGITTPRSRSHPLHFISRSFNPRPPLSARNVGLLS